MTLLSEPTPYPTVNAALAELTAQMQAILGPHLVGIYLSGSLALGDFDPATSDLDLVVVTETNLANTRVVANAQLTALGELHARFDAGGSPWAGKLEVVYADRAALRRPIPKTVRYPQVEKERGLFLEQLEAGWLSICYIVREHGVTLLGPDPRTLVDVVDPTEMRQMVAQIPVMWLRQAYHDPTWLEWLAAQQNQAFVVLTLCRLLYTLETGAVASKPGAARWVQAQFGERWAGLIARALAGQHSQAATPTADVTATVALVEETVRRFREWDKS